MLRMKQILISTIALAASMAGLQGCGQQGPLYLPTDAAAAGRATLPQTLRPGGTEPATAPAPKPAPAASGAG